MVQTLAGAAGGRHVSRQANAAITPTAAKKTGTLPRDSIAKHAAGTRWVTRACSAAVARAQAVEIGLTGVAGAALDRGTARALAIVGTAGSCRTHGVAGTVGTPHKAGAENAIGVGGARVALITDNVWL